MRPPAKRDPTYDATLIGTWTWQPNRIGLEWFLDKVVPHLPDDFTIAIAGSMPAGHAQSPHPGVSFVGRVADAIEFVLSGRVVPLISRAGSGVQLKTIETFELGLPAVATSRSLRGIGARAGKLRRGRRTGRIRPRAASARRAAPGDVDGRALPPRPAAWRSTASLRSGLRALGFQARKGMRMNMHAAPPDARRLVLEGNPGHPGRQHRPRRRRSRLLRGFVAERRFTKVGFLNAHNANVACSRSAVRRGAARFPHPGRRGRRRYRGQAALRRAVPGQPQRHRFHPGLPRRRTAAADHRACSAPSAPTPKPPPPSSARSRRSTASS